MAQKRKRQRPTLRKGSSSARKSNPAKFILPRPVGRVSDLSPRSYSARDRALNTLAAMRRHGVSLSRAAREAGISPKTVRRYLNSEFQQKKSGGRIRATKSDRLVRYLPIPTHDGPMEIAIRGSESASKLARYLNGVKSVLSGENLFALNEFKGMKISGITLITDLDTLKNLAEADQLNIESLYRSLNGGAA